jgi:hypothetical protein
MLLQNPKNPNTRTTSKKREVRHHDAIKTFGGGVVFSGGVKKDNSSSVPTTETRTEVYSGNSRMYMTGGGIGIETHGDISLNGSNVFIETRGNKVEKVRGTKYVYMQNDDVVVTGKQTSEQIKAAKALDKIYEEIEQKKVDKIKSTKGDEVECPTCAKKYLVNRKSGFGTRLFKTLRKYLIPYVGAFAIDVLQSIYNFLIAPMLDEATGQDLLGGTCGNKGCKNGKIQSPQKKLEEGNKAAIEEFKKRSEEIDKQAAKLKGGNKAEIYSGDLTIKTGLGINNSPAYVDTGTFHSGEFRHEPDKSTKAYMAVSGKGSAKRIVKTNPATKVGNFNLHASEKILLEAGSPGLDILTKGHGEMQFGSVTITAGSAEAVFASDNVTSIKGKNVNIYGNDRSGTEGIKLDANHTLVTGALAVNGNFTTLGSLRIDGNLSAPSLITRSMRLQTTHSGSSKTVVNGPQWVGSGQALTVADKAVQLISRDIIPGYAMEPNGIFTIAMESFNLAVMGATVEPLITGFAFFFGCPPYCPPMFLPVWNFKHTHPVTPQTHTHDHTVPHGQYLDDRESWGSAATDGSHVPTPANEIADGPTPGPKSYGGSCGGAGFGFGSPNSNASQAVVARNARFGIIGSDAYGDYDFVNITPNVSSGQWSYDSEGQIQPADKIRFSLDTDCPIDITNLTVNENSEKIDETKC